MTFFQLPGSTCQIINLIKSIEIDGFNGSYPIAVIPATEIYVTKIYDIWQVSEEGEREEGVCAYTKMTCLCVLER